MNKILNELKEAREELTTAFEDFFMQPLSENAQSLTKAMWRYGPALGMAEKENLVLIDLDRSEITEIDPNEDRYTCQPYGVPKCPQCLLPSEECDCGFGGGN